MFRKLRSLRSRFHFDDSEMPFLDHLEELRKTVIRAIAALCIGMVICMPFSKYLIGILRAPAEPYIEKSTPEQLQGTHLQLRISQLDFNNAEIVQDEAGESYYVLDAEVQLPPQTETRRGVIRLKFFEPSAALKMWVGAGFFGGLLISLPALVFIIGLFVMPGVKDRERIALTRIAIFSGVLFLLGVFMGYRITLPLALEMMLKIGTALGGDSDWFYNKYIAFALQLLLGFGLAFQLPVVILILGKMGLVSSYQLREKRRHVIIGLLIVAMVLTPPDVLTQLLMAAPLILLYEFCIWFLYFSGNRGGPEVPDQDTELQRETTTDDDSKELNQD